MTAPEPTAEHIDAVARGMCFPGAVQLAHIHRLASRRILTSTDPAVHAALAASLPAEVIRAEVDRRGLVFGSDVRWVAP